jgi:hypothetical protein
MKAVSRKDLRLFDYPKTHPLRGGDSAIESCEARRVCFARGKMCRLIVVLPHEEAEALARIAYEELRDPRDQLRVILRAELARRGLLPSIDIPQAMSECANALNRRGGTGDDDDAPAG